jgi:hypothetical protein
MLVFDSRNLTGARPAHAGYAVLLTLLAVLTVGAVALFVTVAGSGRSERRLAESEMAADVLMRARAAIIGYSVAQMSGGSRPGQMLAPDTLQNANYNGLQDSGCFDAARVNGLPALSVTSGASANLRCLGRLPWNSIGFDLPDVSQRDAAGLVPWYAASQNLVSPNCMLVLNSQTASRTVMNFVGCGQTTGPAWPWLKVCDAGGRIISDRVAFVLIMPGPPISTEGRTQARPASLGIPRDFLDAIPIPAGWASLPVASRCSKLDNAGLTDEYVIGNISASFNDRLVYVTIDELMEAVERRVATEVRESFLAFKSATNGLPWLAPLANPTDPETATLAVPGTTSGLIPFVANDGGNTNRFLTEVSWSVLPATGADTITGALSSSVSFRCYGGSFECQLRTITGTLISRSITTNTIRSNSIATPTTACAYGLSSGQVRSISCKSDAVVTTPITYSVWRQPCCGGNSYVLVNAAVAGTYRRTFSTSTISVVQGSGDPSLTWSSSQKLAQRTITGQNKSLAGLITVSDTWVPANPGVAPFDFSPGPYLPYWSGTSTGNGSVRFTARAHPIVPGWYFNERWYELAYAAMSTDAAPNASGVSSFCSTNCFSVGGRGNVDAVVIVAGPQLTALSQNRYRPSPTTGDFLEAPNTTGATNRLFAAEKQPRNPTYADTISTIPR